MQLAGKIEGIDGEIAPQKVDLVSYRPLKTKTKRKTGPRTGKREAIAKTMLDELK